MHPSNKDQNFLETINILNKNNVKYWICHGTLLGLIRDKQLIPWDHDIDIAVWSGTISREKIKKIMLSNNFLLKDKHVEDASLTFEKEGGKKVDINFYQMTTLKNNKRKIAYASYNVPKNFFCRLIDALSNAKKYEGKFKYLINFFSIFEFFFKKLKNFLINKKNFYHLASYTQPLELLKEFKDIVFYDINLTVPKKSEEYLRYVYGENWKIPKRKFNWIKDSPSTIKK